MKPEQGRPDSANAGPDDDDPHASDFSSAAWCVALDRDPAWTRVPTLSGRRHRETTENSLVAETLRTSRGLRSVRTYARRSGPGATEPPSELRMLFSVGDGVNGVPGTVHGGMIGLMLDEVTGQLAAAVFGRYSIVTGGLDVRYRRRTPSPSVLLSRAQLAGEVGGRKAAIRGSLEDGEGGLYATCHAVFVRIDTKL